ncbi:MAG: hypothetical protein ACR2OU_08775 [Thermomicrobiales bacterium]
MGIKSPRHGGFSREVRLTLDLGQVQDVAKLQIELGTLNTLPQVEIWLSEDGVTWWNVTSIDGTAMQTDIAYEVPLGYMARYIAIVVPHVEETGVPEIGGIRKVSAWSSTDGNVRTLDTFGPPVTPEPVATEVPLPTDVPVEQNTVEAAPPAGEALPSPDESVPTDVPAAVPTAVPTAVPGGDDQPIIEPDKRGSSARFEPASPGECTRKLTTGSAHVRHRAKIRTARCRMLTPRSGSGYHRFPGGTAYNLPLCGCCDARGHRLAWSSRL